MVEIQINPLIATAKGAISRVQIYKNRCNDERFDCLCRVIADLITPVLNNDADIINPTIATKYPISVDNTRAKHAIMLSRIPLIC